MTLSSGGNSMDGSDGSRSGGNSMQMLVGFLHQTQTVRLLLL